MATKKQLLHCLHAEKSRRMNWCPLCIQTKERERTLHRLGIKVKGGKGSAYWAGWYKKNAARIAQKRHDAFLFMKLNEPEKYELYLDKLRHQRALKRQLMPEEERWERWRKYYAYNREKLSARALKHYWIHKLDHLLAAHSLPLMKKEKLQQASVESLKLQVKELRRTA